MNKKFKFTTALLKSLPANDPLSKSTESEYSDTEITGFKCLCGKSGSKRFLLRYTFYTRKTSIAIGRFPDIDLATARKIARNFKVDIAQGIDPKSHRIEKECEMQAPTVAEFFFETYLPLAKQRKRTWKDDLSRFSLCKTIHDVPYDKLTPQQVLNIQLDLSNECDEHKRYAAATRNRAIALLKTMGKQVEKYLGIPNVAMKVSLLPENNARTRYCDVSETKRIIAAALKYHCKSVGGYISLLFLTGCRISELRLRLWTDVDLVKKTLQIPRTKNGSYHIIYLSDMMIDIIKTLPRVTNNPYLFAGNKVGKPISESWRAFKEIKNKANIRDPEEVVFHTARHSVASNLISNGTDISAVQKLLNHRCIESTLRYAKLSEAKQRETTQYLSTMIQDYNPLDPR
jgi:integrase